MSGKKRIVIVGGGVIGCSCAYYLSKNGKENVEIIVIERNSIAGCASGKAGGFLASSWCSHNESLDILAQESFSLHCKLAKELNGEENYEFRLVDTYSVDMDLSKRIFTNVTSKLPDESPVKEENREWLNGPGIESENINQFQVIGDKSNTAQVHPFYFTNYLLETAKKNGNVKVLIGDVVTSLLVENGMIKGVSINSNSDIYADEVILALGPWSKTIASTWLSKEIGNAIENQIIPEKYYSIVIQPNEENRQKVPGTALFLKNSSPSSKLSEPEVYPRPTGNVYICGCEEVVSLPEDPSTVSTPIREHIDTLASVAAQVSTFLNTKGNQPTAKIIKEQACHLPISKNGVPIIGNIPNINGLWIATAHGCWGILYAPVTGNIISDLILKGNTNILEITPFLPSSLLMK